MVNELEALVDGTKAGKRPSWSISASGRGRLVLITPPEKVPDALDFPPCGTHVV